MISKKSINGLLIAFSIILMLALLHHYNTQVEMVTEIKDVQQELYGQKAAISTVVKILDEEREEKALLKLRQDSLQNQITKLAQIKDSLAITLYKEKKALKDANRHRLRLEKELNDSLSGQPAVSPLEQRFRSKGKISPPRQ